jgi:TP901 family phage tail tape measure protein
MGSNLTSMNIVLGVVNTGLYKGLNAASMRIGKFAGKMKNIGSSLTTSVTLPMALVAGASVKMAMDFEKSMTKIQTLVLGSGEHMDAYSDAVKRISSVTAVSATETADGLYFLTSAGLRGVNALETLTTVNKGVAIGLGESTDLAKVAAAAQNAYGVETITATEAIDAFGMAVRTGMFESSELAESLGTQVGMAAELGISFEELLANISTYTKTTGDARSATTGFGGVMMAFAKETSKGKEALSKVNMTYEGLRAKLQDQGLAATLFELKDAFAANGVQMTELFGKSQAVKNIMGTLGEQGDEYIQILDEMGDSAGFTAEAFDVLAQTPGFQIERSINNIKLSFQEIGDIIMPTIAMIIQGIANLIGWWDALDSSTKNWALAIAGVVAMAGPLFSIMGMLVSAIGFLISPIGMVITAIVALGVAIYKNWDIAKKWIVAIINYWIEIYNESIVFRGAIQLVILAFKTMWENAKFAFGVVYDVIVNFAKSVGTILSGVADIIKGIFTGSWDDVKSGWKKVTSSMGDNFEKAMKSIASRAKTHSENTAKNIKDGINNTLRGELEFVTEDDIQAGVDGMVDWAQQGLAKVKELFSAGEGDDLSFEDIFGDPPPPPKPPGADDGDGEGSSGGGSGSDKQKEWKATLDSQKSALRTHLEGMSEGWKNYFAKQDEQWLSWGAKTQEITMSVTQFIGDTLGQLDAIAQQRHENKMITLDNEYNKELEQLNNKGLSEKEYTKAKEALDQKYADKKKQLEIQAAKREKRMALFKAIIGTAQGIAGALPNIPLAILAGVLGAAQIAAVAAQPIPMARGALAYSPTNAIVGDNPNAMNDPEVIAPLSKLEQIMGKSGGNNVRVTGQISGNEIVLSSDKAQIGLARYA